MSRTSSRLAAQYVDALVEAFEPHRNPEAAVAMKAYMRDQFEFLGINAPQRVRLCREAVHDLPRPEPRDLEVLSRALWRRPERDYQYAANWLLRRHVAHLGPSFIATAEHLLTTRSWWDTVDDLAQNVVGPLVLAHDELVVVMDRWIAQDDIWLARTALLHQNRFTSGTDPERLFRYCRQRAGDNEFFIRKAIGWALREYSKTDPDEVRAFVADHHDDLSGLSRREAMKWLDRHA